MPETARQALERTVACIEATEPLIHAYAQIDALGARAAADAIDAAPEGAPSTVRGAPFAVKEVFSVAGLPARAGCRALSAASAETDAPVVRRLRAAGAVVVGTHVSHELTCGLDEPATRNPWALERYPGGSSAGGGASVAVGSARFALGTDSAGSVRIPAAMTGVVGLKPTAGLLSLRGVVAQASARTLDHVGILARTVADVGDVLHAIAAPIDPPTTRTCEPALAGVRIGRLGGRTLAALDDLIPAEPEVAAAVAEAHEQLLSMGAELVTIEAPALAFAGQATSCLFAAELGAANRELLAKRPGAYHPGVRALLERGLATRPPMLRAAASVRSDVKRELSATFAGQRLDALATPTTPRVAMALSSFDPNAELGTLIPYTCPFNLTGQPAMSIPCGFTTDGLPIGLQLAGERLRDTELLRIAAAYERATAWHLSRPDLRSPARV